MSKANDIFSGLRCDGEEERSIARARNIVEIMEGVSVELCGGGSATVAGVVGRADMRGKFDAVVLSTRSAGVLQNESLKGSLKEGARVIVERTKYCVSLDAKQDAEFDHRVTEYAQAAEMEEILPAGEETGALGVREFFGLSAASRS